MQKSKRCFKTSEGRRWAIDGSRVIVLDRVNQNDLPIKAKVPEGAPSGYGTRSSSGTGEEQGGDVLDSK
ncbi:hypothetical protein WG66_005508, partial [Moniliophthora roreri]